jgi:hypothetical protein
VSSIPAASPEVGGNPDGTASTSGPGRAGYVIGTVLVVVGLLLAGVLFGVGVSRFVDRVDFHPGSLPAGQTSTVHLHQGAYVLTYQSDTRSPSDPTPPNQPVQVTDESGTIVPLVPMSVERSRYNGVGDLCVCYDLGTIVAPHNGRYHVALGPAPDADGWVTMRRDVRWDDVRWLIAGIGGAALGGLVVIAGIVVLIVTAVRRAHHRRPPLPPGWPPPGAPLPAGAHPAWGAPAWGPAPGWGPPPVPPYGWGPPPGPPPGWAAPPGTPPDPRQAP